MPYAAITGWGRCLPPAIMTNDDLATFMDTSDEWISSRTGIKERRISHVPLGELSYVAAARALACADVKAEDVEMIILCTATPDNLAPNTASDVQLRLGAINASAYDVNAACTGFIYGLEMATSMVMSGRHNKILVIGAEKTSNIMNWSDRNMSVLFGDGAGAVLVEASEEQQGLLYSKIGNDPDARNILAATHLGTENDRLDPDFKRITWNFEGQEIFRRATRRMGEACANVLEQSGCTVNDLDVVIPHQANLRIIDAVCKRLNAPEEKVVVTVQKYGNMSAATVPVALVDALEEGRIQPGDQILTCAFGAGLTWGAGLIKWGQRVTPLGESDAQLSPLTQSAAELVKAKIHPET